MTCCCLVLHGRGTFTDANYREQALGPGDVFLHTNREHHVERVAHREWQEWSLSMDQPLEDALEGLGLVKATIGYRTGQDAKVRRDRIAAFEQLHLLLVRPVTDDQVLLGLHRALVAIAPPPEPRHPLDVAAAALSADHRADIDLEQLAVEMGSSVSSFRRLFKERHGEAPREWRNRARLNRAKELLLDDGLRVQDVATLLGYANPFAFSRYFTKFIGISPSTWRQQTH